MILIGRVRGNGAQLANYLMKSPVNDNAEVFDIRGTLHTDDIYLSLREMSLTSELTKSKQGIFHLVINPPQDVSMSAEDWLTCTKIIEKHMPFAAQKRTMVLHEKGHVHMHVAYERYDHTTGKMLPLKFFKLALSKARREIEEVLEQKRTPFRNRDRDDIKKTLTQLWQRSYTAQEFISLALQHGYRIARSESRRPFKVVDQKGIGHDLVRQLKGVVTKQVRERFQGVKLELDKTVIREVRTEVDADYFDRLQANSIAAILEQKKKYDERQEELLAFKEKMLAMKEASKSIVQDSNPLTSSEKKMVEKLEAYKKKQLEKQQRKSLTGKPNRKLETALQQLKLALEEADERDRQKSQNMG
ncbi:relaxase [Niastella caeni]|uniref:Relaxase n=1 Tax=Niastella caeni TaxID=2569763 RepID=A0A4S8I130_9BACT|nr:relaxase [Niastella caeni]THU41868.1 relaxase [Niastella caeni]